MERTNENPKLVEARELQNKLKSFSDDQLEARISELKQKRDDTSDTELKGSLTIEIGFLYCELNSYDRRFPNSDSAKI